VVSFRFLGRDLVNLVTSCRGTQLAADSRKDARLGQGEFQALKDKIF